MPKGVYNRHPQEVRRTCPTCDKSLHHMGYANHVRYCKGKGKGNNQLPTAVRRVTVNDVPVIVTELATDEGRSSVQVSFSTAALASLLKSLRIERP